MYFRPPSYVGPTIYQSGVYAYQPVYQQPTVPVQPNAYNQAYYPNSTANANNNTIYNKNVQSITLDQALIQSLSKRKA